MPAAVPMDNIEALVTFYEEEVSSIWRTDGQRLASKTGCLCRIRILVSLKKQLEEKQLGDEIDK